ncbi:MAG: hypothetical protein U5J63_06160 [Fodinibius sp.]|nr:hypothetical protein [Fodinibius sp.]
MRWPAATKGRSTLRRDNFGSPLTEAGDERLGFFLISEDVSSTPNDLPIDGLSGFYTTPGSSIPVYLPGEMNLIRAEAYVRTQEPGLAVNEIDAIRTKEASEDPFGVGANLPAIPGDWMMIADRGNL